MLKFISRETTWTNSSWVVVGPYAVDDPHDLWERWLLMKRQLWPFWRIRVFTLRGGTRPPKMEPGAVDTGDLLLQFVVPRIPGDP